MTSRTAIAEAFATHRFASAYDHLATDLRWFTNGAPPRVGRDATVEACERLLGDLAHTVAEVVYLETLHDGPDTVVVHTVTRYVDLTGTCVVESQDTFDFEDGDGPGTVVAITSYVAEVADAHSVLATRSSTTQ